MSCPRCGESTIAFTVPPALRTNAPAGVAQLCSHCLDVTEATRDADRATASTVGDDPDFSTVSDAMPTGPAAVPFALALGLLDSLAINRQAVTELLERVEREGVDPLLVLDRLAADPSIEPAVDLDRRIPQVEQLLLE